LEPSEILEVVTPLKFGELIVTFERLLILFSAAYGTSGLPSAATF